MDILKQEIEVRKRQLEEKELMGPKKKYFRRSALLNDERKTEISGNDCQEGVKKVDRVYAQELPRGGQQKDSESRYDVAVKDAGMTLDEMVLIGARLGQPSNKNNDGPDTLRVLEYIQFLWGNQLNQRPLEGKASVNGRNVSATYTRTDSHLRPLFKLLAQNSCPENIFKPLVIIATALTRRNYMAAMNAYLQIAIGNEPWPIGVTMVGIHARTGRERISERKQVHVLDDETKGNFILGLKRLMTQCQTLFPTHPNPCAEYNA